METKPYSLQSPEQIAKDYGGNKQKIAEAMQMGILDPTAGTLAAMFIDRMRNAVQQEAAPQQTVAQQVFAPPAPAMPQGMPAGLGATPEAAAMPAPAAAPPMGMPSPQAGPGMAMGGMVPPYMAGGGLTDLPLPDGMFDEPSNGGFNDGYRGGGLVAFAGGTDEDAVVDPNAPPEASLANAEIGGDVAAVDSDEILVRGRLPTYLSPTLYNMPSDRTDFRPTISGNLGVIDTRSPRATQRAQEIQQYYDRVLSPEERKARRQEDMWMALGQIGARMASTPGSLLQAASAGIAEALPGVRSAAAERRGEERAARQALVAEERTGNRELDTRLGVALDMARQFDTVQQAFDNAQFENTLQRLGFDTELVKARIMAGAGLQQALISAAAQRDVGGMEFRARRAAIFDGVYSNLRQNAALDPEYQRRFAVNPNSADLYLRGLAEREVQRQFGGGTVDLGSY